MFKKSRIKIIVAVMASIVAILSGTLAVILGTSYAQMHTDSRRMLEQYAREYRLETDEDDMQGEQKTEDEKPPMLDRQRPDELHKFDVSTFYSVAVSDDGTVLKTENESGTMYSDEALEAYAKEIINGTAKTGEIKNLTYLKEQKDGYVLVAFIDNAIMQGGMATVFRNTLIFGGIAVIAVFIASVFLAKRIVSPLSLIHI